MCATPEASQPSEMAVPPFLADPPGCHPSRLLPGWAELLKGAHLILAGPGGTPGLPHIGEGRGGG